MKKNTYQDQDFGLYGSSILCAWEKGVIPELISKGLTLEQAKEKAADQGSLVLARLVTNLIVTDGKELVGDLLIDDETTGLTYHALGTDNTAPAVGDAALGAEETRKVWTSRTRSGAQITLSVFYTAAESTYAIKECGVFGGATASGVADSGILFSHYLQAYDNSEGNVDLTFDYILTIG